MHCEAIPLHLQPIEFISNKLFNLKIDHDNTSDTIKHCSHYLSFSRRILMRWQWNHFCLRKKHSSKTSTCLYSQTSVVHMSISETSVVVQSRDASFLGHSRKRRAFLYHSSSFKIIASKGGSSSTREGYTEMG